MEKLLHYVWQHRLFPANGLRTDRGETADVIDPGIHNRNAGPDFFNAKVKVDGTLWVGNVEIHERASDWYRHRHNRDTAYDNVILHVCSTLDDTARTAGGRMLPQVKISVPAGIEANYHELLAEEAYPPCYRVIPHIPPLAIHGWLNALTTERLAEKTSRINACLERTGGDWERTYFITLARNFGFGVNSEAFEEWAFHMPLPAVGKHRDDLFQVEALFIGQAGLLEETAVAPEFQDEYFTKLRKEYLYLAHKFTLTPMNAAKWRFLRLRPQNFPHVRLAQMAELYHSQRADFSRLMQAESSEELRQLLKAKATSYWQTHYTFGKPSAQRSKTLQETSLNLILVNTVAPLLFAYGRHLYDESRCERAFKLLEQTKAERNFITRSWQLAGITAENAADSQAMIQLKRRYCDIKDCLRCRFGCEYLRRKTAYSAPEATPESPL